MAESLKPPPQSSREQLAGLDAAAQEAVLKAEEQAVIAFQKAREAAEHARKLAADAGAATAARESSSSSESVSSEGSSEEEGRKKEVRAESLHLLPVLPCGERTAVKAVAKDAITRITALLQNTDVSRQCPEKLVVAWHGVIKNIRAGGLGIAEVQAAVAGVTGEACVRLCIVDGDDNLEAWRGRLSKQYLDKSQGSTLMGRLFEAKRTESEASLTFVLRMAPLAKAMVLMRLLDECAISTALWRVEALGLDYCKRNATYYEQIRKDIQAGRITGIDQLMAAVQEFQDREDLPKTAAPVTMRKNRTRGKKKGCKDGNHGYHTEATCWVLHPELDPRNSSRRDSANSNEAGRSEYTVLPVGHDVFVVEAAVDGVVLRLGLDSMAALNLIRSDALPRGVEIVAGGPMLHGVGQSEATGTIRAAVTLGDLTFAEVVFAVVDDLPVPALLGKPTLTAMGAVIDLGENVAEVYAGERTAELQVVAIPMVVSNRPQAQSYWTWLARRMAKAPQRLQSVTQDVFERADNKMLEQFLAGFAEWSLMQRQRSGHDDPGVHPAPYQPHLRRPDVVTTGLVVCPTMVQASSILQQAATEADLIVQADDNRDFLPPIMTYKEEEERVEKEIARIVAEAELSDAGKAKLTEMLKERRAAFGMQLRKVNMNQEKVHTHTTGELPAHQPRRVIRDPRVRNAQIEWEKAMMERGVIGPLTCKQPELARPINIHHVIRDKKIRFTTDARTLNEVTVPDSFPVPQPMEALERFRRNKIFSTTDEADSFFQYPYDDESRVPFYSAQGGILEFRVVIQGGRNSPSALHRAKTRQYAAFSPDEFAFMFDDSLLGTSGSEDDHLQLIDQFLANCIKNGTILKPSKSKLCRSEVVHQGFVLGHGHVRKDPEAIRPIVEMRMPTTASELKSQMSMLGRYRHFVPEYAQLATPLEAIMNDRWKDDTFGSAHEELLLKIRRGIAQETMLTMPDWNRPFHWRIDAQPTYGLAGVVGQEDDTGKFWPIRFMSKKASEADTKRWPTEMEAMAWYYCLADKGRMYSQYSENIIHGDPKSLRWLADSIESGRANRQMQRVALALQAVDITFMYHPREEMADVDALSRFAVDRRGSREALMRFLETDEPEVESTLIAAVATLPTREMPNRHKSPEKTESAQIAVPAAVGPDSPPGVPIDLRAEQELDPVCKFIVMIKRGEFRDVAEQDAFLASMPPKVGKALKQHMDVAGSREFGDFEIRNAKLFLVDTNRLKEPRYRFVVPLRLCARVLTANHDAASAGHRGFDKTYEAMMRLYFWFGMYADTKAWVKSCPACAKGKRRTIAGHGTAKHMGLMPMKFPPYERAVIDLIGPLPESRDGMKHILISVDAHSSETKLDALKSKNSEDIANILLRRVVLAEGCPKSWQTDRAPELIKAAVEKLAKVAGIDPKACSAYQAHVEGRVERRNWLVAMMLREMCKDDPQGWPEMLPWVEYAINSSVYSVTGMTPYFHKTGYDSISPANAWREIGEESGEPTVTWSKRMIKATAFAELAHAAAAEERKEQYDRGKREHGIEDGDSVYMWVARENKLQQSAVGPMIVKRFLDPNTKRSAVLHPPGRPDETVVVHVDRLIKTQERPAHLVQIPSDLADWIAQQELGGQEQVSREEMDGPPQVTQIQRAAKDKEKKIWDIERIVARDDQKEEARRYRVHFKGYDNADDDRWYDEEDLRKMGKETIAMLDEFDAEQDKVDLQKRIAPRADNGALRRSIRQRNRVKFKGG